MSVEVLRKSLQLVEEEDGLDVDKKRKKVTRVSMAARDRQRIRALAAHMEFDCEKGDFVEYRNAKRRRCHDDEEITKPGVCLVEQHRAEKHVDLLKRNIKYMVYTDENKLDSNKVESIIAIMSRRERERKRMLRRLLQQNDGIREPNPRKQKRKRNESVFTDEDFMKIGPPKKAMINKKELRGRKRLQTDG